MITGPYGWVRIIHANTFTRIHQMLWNQERKIAKPIKSNQISNLKYYQTMDSTYLYLLLVPVQWWKYSRSVLYSHYMIGSQSLHCYSHRCYHSSWQRYNRSASPDCRQERWIHCDHLRVKPSMYRWNERN